MKKIIKFVFSMILLIGLLFSCSNPSDIIVPKGGNDSITNLPVIDLRIKNADGQAIARLAEDDNYEFSYKYLEIGGNPKMGLLTDEEAKNILSFEDDPKGIKINFTMPEKYDDYDLNWFELVYIDGNGNWSTRQQVERFVYAGKREFSWLYPLVIPGHTVKFSIQIMMGRGEAETNFQIFYEVTPRHGIGIVDDLPAEYDESKYISYNNGKVSLNDVIPPDSSTIVTKSLGYWGAEHSDKSQVWDGTSNMFNCYPGGIQLDYYGSPTDFYLFTESSSEKPYFFIQCGYDYTIEGYEGLSFASPRICTNPIENNFFTLPSTSRSFSNTKMVTTDSGYEVSFSGDTPLDGLFITNGLNSFEHDIFSQAHGIYFFEGNVYFVVVNESGYSLKDSISINSCANELKFTETGFEIKVLSYSLDTDVPEISGQLVYTRQEGIEKIVIKK